MNTDNGKELFPIVDEQGNILGKATRELCHGGSRLLHPVVHLHVFDPEGRLFLQKRPIWKDIQPGRWDTAVGGHIDYGEEVIHALHREASEELSLSDFDEQLLTKYVFESDRERELIYAFKTITRQKPRPSEETDGGRFWKQTEIVENLGNGVFTPNFEQEYRRLFMQDSAS